jgi:two-component system chemotaxis response regulator CheB
MESAAEHYGPVVIGVILTGMGNDGAKGAGRIRVAGGKIIAEHESTSIVYGMPQSVIAAGLADRVEPLQAIPSVLLEWANHR